MKKENTTSKKIDTDDNIIVQGSTLANFSFNLLFVYKGTIVTEVLSNGEIWICDGDYYVAFLRNGNDECHVILTPIDSDIEAIA